MERGSKQRIIVPIIKKGGAPFWLPVFEANLRRVGLPIIKKGGAPFVSLRMAKIAANGTGKLPIQTMGAFLKKKVVVSMARPQQCG